ncbi:hypothetical protein ACOQGV_004147 [Escherichia coli]
MQLYHRLKGRNGLCREGGYGAERETVTALTGGHRRPSPSAITCAISGGFHALRALNFYVAHSSVKLNKSGSGRVTGSSWPAFCSGIEGEPEMSKNSDL